MTIIFHDTKTALIPETCLRNCKQVFTLESNAKWLRDNTGELHVTQHLDKFYITITGEQIFSPHITSNYIGALFEIISDSRDLKYFTTEENWPTEESIDIQSLLYHPEYEMSIKIDVEDKITDDTLLSCEAVKYEKDGKPAKAGWYSYKRKLFAYLKTFSSIINSDNGKISWTLMFQEK